MGASFGVEVARSSGVVAGTGTVPARTVGCTTRTRGYSQRRQV